VYVFLPDGEMPSDRSPRPSGGLDDLYVVKSEGGQIADNCPCSVSTDNRQLTTNRSSRTERVPCRRSGRTSEAIERLEQVPQRGTILWGLRLHVEEKVVEGIGRKVYDLCLRAKRYLVAVSQLESFAGG
jgi:hypothetical protein